jgi:spore germination cell wall hydrolase CwlJ-like protein
MLRFSDVALGIILTAYEGMPTLAHPKEEYMCMAHAIYHESADQSVEGQIAVGHLLLTRSQDPRWPDSVCANIIPSQFEYLKRGLLLLDVHNSIEEKALYVAFKLSVHILEGHLPDPTNGADHFYNPNRSNPKWARKAVSRKRIEDHLFLQVPW